MTKPRILIVDDDADISTMLSTMATRVGLEVTIVGTAMAAMREFWGAGDEGRPFVGSFLDFGLPGSDGFDGLAVAERMRDAEHKYKSLGKSFLFGFTGHPENQISEAARVRAKLDRYTTKPGDVAEIEAVMRSLAEGRDGN